MHTEFSFPHTQYTGGTASPRPHSTGLKLLDSSVSDSLIHHCASLTTGGLNDSLIHSSSSAVRWWWWWSQQSQSRAKQSEGIPFLQFPSFFNHRHHQACWSMDFVAVCHLMFSYGHSSPAQSPPLHILWMGKTRTQGRKEWKGRGQRRHRESDNSVCWELALREQSHSCVWTSSIQSTPGHPVTSSLQICNKTMTQKNARITGDKTTV